MENNIDFNGVKPYETEVCDNLYSVALEKREGSQEDIDRFQYEIMKRSELDVDLRDVGIEINNFEDFQEFRKDSDIQLDIVLNYMSVEDESSKLVASALYGQNSTTISDVPLNDTEQKQFDELCLPAILEDKEKLEEAEHGEPDIALD